MASNPDELSTKVKVGIIGPRRERTGLGAIIASKIVQRDDTELVAILEKDEEASTQAASVLRAINPKIRAYSTETVMDFFQQSLDVIIICSPPSTHAHYAEIAIASGIDVLVEKPFVATSNSLDATLQAVQLVEKATRQQLYVYANTMHVETLNEIAALLPDRKEDKSIKITMDIGSKTGSVMTPEQLWDDLAPHALSLLIHLAGEDFQDAVIIKRSSVYSPKHCAVSTKFEYIAGDRRYDVSVTLNQVSTQGISEIRISIGKDLYRLGGENLSGSYRRVVVHNGLSYVVLDPVNSILDRVVRNSREPDYNQDRLICNPEALVLNVALTDMLKDQKVYQELMRQKEVWLK